MEKDEFLHIRLPAGQKRLLEQAAKGDFKDVSAWARDILTAAARRAIKKGQAHEREGGRPKKERE